MIQTQFLEGDEGAELSDEMSLERSHVVDSVRALELILFIEETFGISVANEEAVPENFDTVNAIVSYVERKRGEQ
jgi:acyl carrier protein